MYVGSKVGEEGGALVGGAVGKGVVLPDM